MHQSKVKMCFLRGPLRWLTEQKNPKFLWSLQNAKHDTRIWLQVGILQAEYCNADRITWKLTLQDIKTTPKELKTERDCSPRQLFRPLWSSSVWRNNQRKLFGVFKTNVAIFRVISFYASWKFLLWLGNSAWDFLGDKFWSSDFLGFCLKPKGFLGVLIFPPFDHPCHLKSGVPPMGRELLKRTLNFPHFSSQVNLYFSD